MKLLPKCIWKTIFLFLAAYGVAINVNTRHKVFVDSIVSGIRSGAENILQGNVAGLRIKNWSGIRGTQSILNLRGLSLDPRRQINIV